MSENEIKTKICKGNCGLDKTLSAFGKESRSKDGLKSECRECLNIKNRVYMAKKRAENPAEVNRKTREWRKKQVEKDPDYWAKEYWKTPEACRKNSLKSYFKYHDKSIARNKKLRKENPQKSLDASHRWKENNIEQSRSKHREWIKNNYERVLNYNRMRRAKKRGATIQNFSDEQLMQRMAVFGFKCAYCNEGNFEHIDHVIPLSKGGKHCLANLRPACAPCNLSKHDKNLKDWLEFMKRKQDNK